MTSGGSNIGRLLWVLGTAVSALVLTTFVSGLWTALLVVNLQTSPIVPWSAIVMAVLLWALWQYAGGRWWPSTTSHARRARLRANPVGGRVFTTALVAGACSLTALTGIWIVLFQTGLMRGNSAPRLLAISNTNGRRRPGDGVTRWSVCRGGGLPRVSPGRAGTRALCAGCDCDGRRRADPGHGLTQGFAGPTVLFYLLVDVMLGVTAYLCNSVWPGVAVHAIGLLIFFGLVWPFDSLRPVAGNALADWWFWLHAAQAAVFSVLAILAFRRLANVARNRHASVAV